MTENYLTEDEKIIKEAIEEKFNIIPNLVVYDKDDYCKILSILFWDENDKNEFYEKAKLSRYCDYSDIKSYSLCIIIYDDKVDDILKYINNYKV